MTTPDPLLVWGTVIVDSHGATHAGRVVAEEWVGGRHYNYFRAASGRLFQETYVWAGMGDARVWCEVHPNSIREGGDATTGTASV